MERGGILHEWVILCLGTRIAQSEDAKSLTHHLDDDGGDDEDDDDDDENDDDDKFAVFFSWLNFFPYLNQAIGHASQSVKTYSFWIASFLPVDYRGHSRRPRCYAAEGEECLNGLGETEENRKEYSYYFYWFTPFKQYQNTY